MSVGARMFGSARASPSSEFAGSFQTVSASNPNRWARLARKSPCRITYGCIEDLSGGPEASLLRRGPGARDPRLAMALVGRSPFADPVGERLDVGLREHRAEGHRAGRGAHVDAGELVHQVALLEASRENVDRGEVAVVFTQGRSDHALARRNAVALFAAAAVARKDGRNVARVAWVSRRAFHAQAVVAATGRRAGATVGRHR